MFSQFKDTGALQALVSLLFAYIDRVTHFEKRIHPRQL